MLCKMKCGFNVLGNVSALLVLIFLFVPAVLGEVELKHEVEEGRVDVFMRGEHFTSYHYGEEARTPYLWPVNGEGGVGLTRNFPMGEDGVADRDHPHHRSIWFTFGDVNGSDHWHNESIATRKVETGDGEGFSYIRAHNDWLDKDGEAILHEVHELRFRDQPATGRLIELVTTLQANYGDVTFGDNKEGLAAVRVRPELKGSRAGVMTSAHGRQGEKEVYGTPAPWMDYSGRLEGHGWRGIAIFDHPDNFRSGYWHARDYGLMALNPFSKKGVGGLDEDGSHVLEEGGALTLRYAWFVHSGDHEEADIAGAYKKFIGE